MHNIEEKIISKNDFLKLNEDDVMFITNPGRMGDEDGITFVVKKNNKLIIYRVNGWMYPNKNIKEDEYISLDDAKIIFSKWYERWKNWNNENYQGKYQYLYMGFGNGLSIDNSIYSEFEPYLNKYIEEFLKDKDNKEDYKYSVIFNVWKKALKEMIKEKKCK